MLHVHYVCLPETWSKAIEILRKIDRYFTLERTYDYTPEDVYVTLIKLQKELGFNQTKWDQKYIIREEMNVLREDEAYRLIADDIVKNAIMDGKNLG